MQTHADPQQKVQSQASAHNMPSEKNGGLPLSSFEDERPEAIQLRAIQLMADNSPQVRYGTQIQRMADGNTGKVKQEQAVPPATRKENRTGLPDNLKQGIEDLSGGHSLNDVRVHYNSSQPTQLKAHAFTQGSQIHIAPGQEKHLAHEAWHVVQQKQGRVRPTIQLKQTAVNDDAGLEAEADQMGERASQFRSGSQAVQRMGVSDTEQSGGMIAQLVALDSARLNVVGEDHSESGPRIDEEKEFTAENAGSSKYWTENQFRDQAYSFCRDFLNDRRAFADPFELRFNNAQGFLADNAAIILADANQNRTHLAAWNNLNGQQRFIGNLWTNLSSLDAGICGCINAFSGQSDGFEVLEDRKEEMLGYRQSVKNIAATWQVARVALAADRNGPVPAPEFDWADDGVVVASEANPRANFHRSVMALTQLNVVNRTVDQLSSDRSDAMHLVANNRSGELGVWKIGDSHRADMDTKQRNYNLVSKDEFNVDLTDWRDGGNQGDEDELRLL